MLLLKAAFFIYLFFNRQNVSVLQRYFSYFAWKATKFRQTYYLQTCQLHRSTDPQLQAGYQTGLALWEPQAQATSLLNLLSSAAGVLRGRASILARFQSSHSEHSKESAEPQLISSADPELTHYGELESFHSDLHTFIIWGQEYLSSLNNEELNTCMRS